MKNLFLFFTVCVVSLGCFAQEYGPGAVPVKNGVVTFSEVVKREGISQSDLYASAKTTIAEIFKSAKDVIQSDDKESGIIICKGNSEITEPFINNLMEFTLKLSCREGRYRIDLYDILLTVGYGGNMPMTFKADNTIIDEKALKNGTIKKKGEGKQRKMIIDEKNRIFSLIKDKMNQTSVEEEW